MTKNHRRLGPDYMKTLRRGRYITPFQQIILLSQYRPGEPECPVQLNMIISDFMEIIIHDKAAYEHSLEKNEIQWQLYVRKGRRNILIQYGIGILFLIIGFFPTYDSGINTKYANDDTHQNETKNDKDSTNIALVVGIVYIILVSGSLFRQGRAKVAFMDEAGYKGRIIYKASNESMISINEERIRYENPVEKTEWKWAAFLIFSLYKNYLILSFDRDSRSSFFIDERLLSAESYQKLLDLVRQKVREGKV